MNWNQNYSVGLQVIDSDHQELFDAVNHLHMILEEAPGTSDLSQVTDRLVRYVKEHFQREKRLMFEYDYPGLRRTARNIRPS